MDKTKLNTIVTIIGIIFTIVSIILSISIILSNSGWYGARPWIFLVVALFVNLSLIYIRRQQFQKIVNALKPKPKLNITVRDITCYASIDFFREEEQNPGHKSDHIALKIVCTVKIMNKSKAVATRILREVKLTVKQGENSFYCKSNKTGRTYELAKNDEPRQERISFETKYFLPKDFLYYPDAAYTLDYIYQCREQPKKSLTATCDGTLTKADWAGQRLIPETKTNGIINAAHWIPDEEVLKIIRRLGFIDPF